MLLHLYLYGTTVLILSQAFGYDNCNRTYSNNNGLEVYQCFPCKPGYIAIDDCSGNFTRAKCEECQNGTYQPECVTFNGNVSCKPCTVCDVYKENCTIYKDAVCEHEHDLLEWRVVILGVFVFVVVCVVVVVVVVRVDIIKWFSKRGMQCPLKESISSDDHELSFISHHTEIDLCLDTNSLDSETTLNSSSESLRNYEYDAVDCHETEPLKSNKTERQLDLVYPYDRTKSNDCKEVEHTDKGLQLRTWERIQVAGDSNNVQEGSTENKNQENQLHPEAEDKGTPEVQTDWTQVFLQLSKSFSATRWKFFAIHLLNNCQAMARSVGDTVDEIELEAKNQHTVGWVTHAYFKVFSKWLNNLGSKKATFEHIKNAATEAFDTEEDIKRVDFIERNPPMKEIEQGLVPRKFEPPFGSNFSLQQSIALHNDEEPGNSNCRIELYSSSQTTLFQFEFFPNFPLYTRNEIADRHETLTSVQSNESYRKENKKRKKDQSKTQQHKRRITEKYIIENAKENLYLDFIPIRQNDYDMYMKFVIELIANECQVAERTVWSVTQAGFCEAHEVNNKEKGTLFVINCERINLCIRKETFEELTFYGNIARPKLLKYLKETSPEYDSTTSETFMFINFNGTPLFELLEDKDDQNGSNITTKEKDTKQRSKVKSSTGSSIKARPYMKESEENIDEYKPRRKQNSSDQPSESEQINRCFSKISTFDTKEYEPIEEERASKSTSNHEKEISNKAEDEQEIVKSQMNDIKKKEIESLEVDMETETESIRGWLSHKFCEIS